MTGSSSTTLVANPIYEAYSRLYAQLRRDADTMTNALKPADQQMQAGQTWVGSTGQSWGSQLDGHSRDCGVQVNAMLADVEQAMRSEPAQVTPQEAQVKSKTLMLMSREE